MSYLTHKNEFFQASIEVKEAGKRAIQVTPNVLSSTVLGMQYLTFELEFVACKTKTFHLSGRDSKKMSSTTTSNSLFILHYNDIYNIDANSTAEPIGGATRFSTAIKSFSHLNPLILFSGDAFSPSMRKTMANLL